MDIRQLRYFIAIAETGSVSAAALRLNIAQPSLSQHLVNMEQDLQVQLVVRSPRGSTLTAEGELLLRHAKEICEAMSRCVTELRETGQHVAGKVHFGMPPSVSMVMSVPLSETVRLELPQVRLRVSEAMSGFIKSWIEDETVEIGFLYDLKDISRLHATHVLNEQLYFFSAPDAWPLDTPPGAAVPLKALEQLDLILPGEPHGLRRIVEEAAAQSGVSLNVVTELDAMTQIKELVARGSGFSIFAPAACHDYVQEGKLLKSPIVDPTISRPVYLVKNPLRTQTRASAAIEKMTLKVAAEMVGRGIWEGELVWTPE
ncbi:LysR family transcriptional regulator [Neptunicoccus cionae]|uniref:LysR family transcriptional regulator n=1 Tax=Neptunicoccus cionae TaxID=2035344 RepID=A0A916R1T9_9RHOB|nr:LysR family transcriptional regulator [Amylibacter cionae]GGA25374.1 LysR family transcriptional regulator [Amylibacter cionae]